MTHPRKILRDATKARLEGLQIGDSTLSFEVITPAEKQSKAGVKLAIGVVSTPAEASERASKAGDLDRAVELVLVVTIDGTNPIPMQDDLDAWAELVEDRMKIGGPPTPAKRCTLTATTFDALSDEEGVNWIADLTFTFQAEIFS